MGEVLLIVCWKSPQFPEGIVGPQTKGLFLLVGFSIVSHLHKDKHSINYFLIIKMRLIVECVCLKMETGKTAHELLTDKAKHFQHSLLSLVLFQSSAEDVKKEKRERECGRCLR